MPGYLATVERRGSALVVLNAAGVAIFATCGGSDADLVTETRIREAVRPLKMTRQAHFLRERAA